jgi:hypothetical protein
LQNPHGLPPSLAINSAATTVLKKEQELKPTTAKAVSEVKVKAAVPCELLRFPPQDIA